MVRVLPDRFGDDERGRRINAGKDLHALLLGADETVLERGLVGMGAHEHAAEGGDNFGELLLHGVLGGREHCNPDYVVRRDHYVFRCAKRVKAQRNPLILDLRRARGFELEGGALSPPMG
jgi:hypothetical protein